jgi:hypothetical protein
MLKFDWHQENSFVGARHPVGEKTVNFLKERATNAVGSTLDTTGKKYLQGKLFFQAP